MGSPSYLVQNYFSDIAFPTHTISAEEEASGFEAWRVADGRRSAADHWKSTTANSETWVKFDTGAAGTITAAPHIVGLDRGHNLPGVVGVKFQLSANDADWTDLVSVTIPASASSATALNATNGATTEEGAWLKQVTPASTYRYGRLLVPAMGAGLVPKVVGLWFGPSWQPGNPTMPVPDEDYEPIYEETIVPSSGWRGRSKMVALRTGELTYKFASEAEYITARGHLWDHFRYNRPMWVVHDDTYAERAVLAVPRTERQGFGFHADWWNMRRGVIPWIEHEPLVDR